GRGCFGGRHHSFPGDGAALNGAPRFPVCSAMSCSSVRLEEMIRLRCLPRHKLEASKNLAVSAGLLFDQPGLRWGAEMRGQAGFFDVDERLKQLSAKGDNLERLNAVVDFELFRADLERAVPRSDGSKGGRPPFDHVLMFKTLILQSTHNLSD